MSNVKSSNKGPIIKEKIEKCEQVLIPSNNIKEEIQEKRREENNIKENNKLNSKDKNEEINIIIEQIQIEKDNLKQRIINSYENTKMEEADV